LEELKAEIFEHREEIVEMEERLSHMLDKMARQLTIRLGCLMVVDIVLVILLDKLFN